MKAEEVIKKHVPSVVSGTQVKKYGDVTIIEMMKEYARHKLKEQRELCADEMRTTTDEANKTLYAPAHDAIIDAPEPKLD